MDPKTWGPGLWSVIHGLPVYGSTLQNVKAFYSALAVPCEKCQGHLESFRAENPIGNIETRQQAFSWSVKLHNSVNSRLGKRHYDEGECYKVHCQGKADETESGKNVVLLF